MKKSFKMLVAGLVLAAAITGVSTSVHARTEPVGGETCDSGTTGLCWVITVNGVKNAKCKETSGTTKDCKYVAPPV